MAENNMKECRTSEITLIQLHGNKTYYIEFNNIFFLQTLHETVSLLITLQFKWD